MLERPDPETLLAGPLGGWLQQQMHLREDAKRISADRLYKAALIGIPALAFLLVLGPGTLQPVIWLAIMGGAGAFAWTQMPKRKAVRAVKAGINQSIAEALGLTYSLNVTERDGFERAKQFGMFPAFQRASFEDQWSGMASGHRFCLHELHLEEKHGAGNNVRWDTVFRGTMMVIGATRPTHGVTLVQRAGTYRKLLGGAKDGITLAGHHLRHINMVDPRFDNTFQVYSSDPVEAQYLVHPAYVERLIQLEAGMRGQDVCALFYQGELLVVLKTENLFESASINSEEDRWRVAQTIEQFGKLADLAASLNEWDKAERKAGLMRAADPAAQAMPVQDAPDAAPVPVRAMGFGRKGL